MESRSRNRFAGVMVVCAATSLALAPAAAGNVPGQVAETQRTVGEAIAQVLRAPAPPPKPVPAPRPAPAQRPAAPAPKAPSPPAARSAAPEPVNRASTARATASSADASSGQAAPAAPKPAAAHAARDTRTAGTPERADPANRIELVSAGDLSADAGEESPSTLPFTGLPLLPLMAAGLFALFAGMGLRRTVQ